jgi:UDP-N-acetyl-D-mannosaminuronic acid transferase (WecB/TagA/CpsF family)
MMQVTGMESLFQLAIAPRRCARRYRVDDPASSTYPIRTELRTMVNAAIVETG